MMIEQATVIHYQQGIALIQCQRKAGCGSCSAQGSCGAKALSALTGEKIAPQFSLSVPEPLQIGDRIEIGLAEKSLLSGVFWLYGLPLFVLMATTLLLSLLGVAEIFVALGVVFTTMATFWGIKQRFANQPLANFTPQFLRKI
ncbi:transcriptional regulator [Pasteurellaceae bacterium Macca]|nr:transcriptional regulator [Pasteurellaceae bacterium Macca]